jgi:2-octaprenyl-6-methoxyphenol hydroxylase
VNQPEYDLIIAGGGMVGASLACALAPQGLRIALIEKVGINTGAQPSYDDRGLALSISSRRILQRLEIWPRLAAQATAIRQIHVSDRGCFGCVRLHAADIQIDALGHVVTARELGAALMHRLSGLGSVAVICPAEVNAVEMDHDAAVVAVDGAGGDRSLRSRLLVVADGAHSRLRSQLGIAARVRDYRQTALVSNVSLGRPHANTAYERFTDTGPMALLPLDGQRAVLIHTVPADAAGDYLQMGAAAYLDVIGQRFGRRLGRFSKVGVIKPYSLQMVEAEAQVAGRAVLLGGAAHTLHPNGAQGFNLCLRDVAALAEQLARARMNGEDIGTRSVLDAYQAARQQDQQRVIRFSDRLAGLFYNRQFLKVVARNAGMLLVDIFPGLKQELIRNALGLTGRQPAMVSGAWV